MFPPQVGTDNLILPSLQVSVFGRLCHPSFQECVGGLQDVLELDEKLLHFYASHIPHSTPCIMMLLVSSVILQKAACI